MAAAAVVALLFLQLMPASAILGDNPASEVLTSQAATNRAIAGFLANATVGPPPAAGSHGVGAFNYSTAQWHLRTRGGDPTVFPFGDPNDIPLVGDWNNDGTDTVGVYDPQTGAVELRNSNSAGAADLSYSIAPALMIPFAGDFDGDGFDSVGVFNLADQKVYIFNATTGALDIATPDDSFTFGAVGQQPFAGDFNNLGTDTVGFFDAGTGTVSFRGAGTNGIPSDFTDAALIGLYITGDWDGDGVDTPGVFDISNSVHLRDANSAASNDEYYTWGQSNWIPVAGDFGPLTSDVAVSLTGAPESLEWAVESLYLEFPSAPYLPNGLRSRLSGLPDAGNTNTLNGTAGTADAYGAGVAAVAIGSDRVFAVSEDGWTWRVVGAHIVSEGKSRWLGDGPRFITLIGTDMLNGSAASSIDPALTNADSVHLYSVVPETGVGSIVGFARDHILRPDPNYTYLPGTFYDDPIDNPDRGPRQELHKVNIDNGPEATNATLAYVTGLPIEGYVLTGWGTESGVVPTPTTPGFTDLINDFGGFGEFYVPYAYPSQCLGTPPPPMATPGWDTLDGVRSLGLSRERKCTGVSGIINGNQPRNLTQGIMLKSAAAIVQDGGVTMLPTLLDIMDDTTVTDLSVEDMVQIAATIYAVDTAVDPGTTPTLTEVDLSNQGVKAYNNRPGSLPNVNTDGCVSAFKWKDGIEPAEYGYAQYFQPHNFAMFNDLSDAILDTYPIWTYGSSAEAVCDYPNVQHFTDVFPNKWYYGNVENLAYARITTGYPDNSFRPANNVPRREMAPFMVRSAGKTEGNCPPSAFPDVPDGQWYCGWVKTLVDEGIAEGYPDGTFRPNQDMTRAEVAALIVRALGYDDPPVPTETPFSDVPVTKWYAKWVDKLKELGITTGYPDGTYRPNNTMTRAEFAAVLDRSFLSG